MSPFAGYTNFADCVRQNSDKNNPDAYCGSIKHKTEDKLAKAVTAASHLNQAVRLALSAVAKRDPVKEEGDKKLKEADGIAADGAQDDQAFAVAYGPDNYDKLTKTILAAPYRQAYRAAGAIVKALENKQMNFPGNLEDHLKKAHAAIHGREMWDARYSDVCDLLKRARKLLHDIEKTAEVSQQGGDVPQIMGKADPVDKGLQQNPMGVSGGGGVAKPGWAQTKQPIPGGGSKKPGTIPQAKLQTPRQAARTRQKFARDQWGGKAHQRKGRWGGLDIEPSKKKPQPVSVNPHSTWAPGTAPRPPKKALRKAVTAAVRNAQFRPSPADPKRGELPKKPSAAERYAGRAPGDTSKPPSGWSTSKFNPVNKPGR